VRQAWLDRDTAAQNYRTAQAALQTARSAYDVIVLRVQNQKGIQVEQLDALTALIRTRANLAQALYDHTLAAARLQRATGRL
jgi:outer membrane protein TolC